MTLLASDQKKRGNSLEEELNEIKSQTPSYNSSTPSTTIGLFSENIKKELDDVFFCAMWNLQKTIDKISDKSVRKAALQLKKEIYDDFYRPSVNPEINSLMKVLNDVNTFLLSTCCIGGTEEKASSSIQDKKQQVTDFIQKAEDIHVKSSGGQKIAGAMIVLAGSVLAFLSALSVVGIYLGATYKSVRIMQSGRDRFWGPKRDLSKSMKTLANKVKKYQPE